MRLYWISIASGVLAFLVAAARINHGLVDSALPNGPGLTSDESFNIEQGVYLFDAIAQHGPLLLTPSVAREVFGDPAYLPDHPPLGRLLLGVAHELTSWAIPGSEECLYNVPAARLGSCFAFGLMVFLIAEFTRRRQGCVGAAIVSLMLMAAPQIVGHARIAALEAATMLAWIAALLPLLAWWTGDKPPTTQQAVISGGLWGLLLLTKVQGILLPPVVVAWAIWRFRHRNARPVVVWGITGLVVFFACWPWLWLNPGGHTLQFLGRTVDRQTLYCWYLGERFTDKLVPWHYPFVLTCLALPAPTLLGIVATGRRSLANPVDQLLLITALFPLMVFAMPGTPVYDGSRLFSVSLPVLTMFLARRIQDDTLSWSRPLSNSNGQPPKLRLLDLWFVPCVTIFAGLNLDAGPTSLTRSEKLFAIDRLADRLDLETAYWSEGLNSDFWRDVPEHATVYVAPVSHQFQLSDIEALVPIVRQRDIHLEAYQYDPEKQKGLLLLLHRLADLRPSLRSDPPGAEPIVVVTQDDMILARLIDTTNATMPAD